MPYCEIKGELLLSEQRIYFAADEKEYANLMVHYIKNKISIFFIKF
jgi:hypothetical protein